MDVQRPAAGGCVHVEFPRDPELRGLLRVRDLPGTCDRPVVEAMRRRPVIMVISQFHGVLIHSVRQRCACGVLNASVKKQHHTVANGLVLLRPYDPRPLTV